VKRVRPQPVKLAVCIRRTALLSLVAAVAGCATMAPPRAWEKGTLARPDMQFDAAPLDTKTTQHIYASREAATGGHGVGGGGCGCN